MLRSLACLLILPLGLVLSSAWAIVLARLGAPRRRIDDVINGFACFCAWLAGTRLDVNGLDRLQADQAYVIVPNHESNWDVVVLLATLRHLSIRGAFKKEVLRVPFFGRGLLLTGFVVVDRHDTRGDVERLQRGMDSLPGDVSVLFYAEGRRSVDGELQPFKKGAFVTAIAKGMPVLPIGTAGSRRLWPRGSLRIRSGPVAVEIGAPISVTGLTLEDRDRLSAEVRAAVAECRAQARRRLRALGVDPEAVDG